MKRTKQPEDLPTNLPDAIYLGPASEFTQIPNSLIRNTLISGKAKALLFVLLSNKEGWKSHLSALEKHMKENRDAIRSGIKELEEFGYLIRIKYRNKNNKKWVGSFWAYTSISGKFNMTKQLQDLLDLGYEIAEYNGNKPQPDFPTMAFPSMDIPYMENPPLIILIDKNIKDKNIKEAKASSSPLGKLRVSDFDKFWELYPRKIYKGKAYKIFERICSKYNDLTWQRIRSAILKQIKSQQWSDPKFIPHPTTWLNQARWMDDATEMKIYSKHQTNKTNIHKDEVERKFKY